jgi:hypothetical protein
LFLAMIGILTTVEMIEWVGRHQPKDCIVDLRIRI